MAASAISLAVYLSLNHCVAKVFAGRSVIGWQLLLSNSTKVTTGRVASASIQAITVDTVIAYITHEGHDDISSASNKPAWGEATWHIVGPIRVRCVWAVDE